MLKNEKKCLIIIIRKYFNLENFRYIYNVRFNFRNKLLLNNLKCSILNRAILIGEVTTHKFTKILFRYCQFHAWWRSSEDKIL